MGHIGQAINLDLKDMSIKGRLSYELLNSSFEFKFVSKIQLLYLVTYFSYLFLVVWFLFVCVFLFSFFCFVSHMSWVGA